MACVSGTKIVNEGLVFYFNMSNARKSFKGKPTTNLATNTPTQSGWQGSYSLINSNTKTFDVTTQLNNSSNGSAWRTWYWDVSSYVGSTVTISGDVEFVEANNAEFLHVTIGQGNTGSYPVHIAGSDAADKVQVSTRPDQKIHMTWTGTINSAGLVGFTQWITNVTVDGGNVTLRISNVQIEVNGFETPFVNGTRSNTESIIDLTGNETITISDLTYNSNNTFEFDGANDVFTVTNTNNYPATWDDPFTLEALTRIPTGATWHHVDGGTTNNTGTGIIGRGGYSGSIGLLRNGNNGSESLRFYMRSENRYNYATLFSAQYDTWYHMVGTFDGTNMKLYINGNLIQTTAMNKGVDVPDTGNWRIGGNTAFGGNTGLYGEGEIPEVKFYNRSLTAKEVKYNYEAVKTRYNI